MDASRPFGVRLETHGVKGVLQAAPRGEHWEVWLEAERDGVSILGRDPRFPVDQYRHRLDGRYSIIARRPDGRLKVKQDRVGRLLRTFWGFDAVVAGKPVRGWIELAPLPMTEQGPVRLVPLTAARQAPRSRTVPKRDRDDRQTGFRAVLRDYHWSGTDGKAWVITFDDRMRWRAKDLKLVFPERAAWVPGYQLSDRHLVQFEFIETWGGGAPGCYEPMSDRVDRFGGVRLVEDLPDRKTLVWTYQLANPDYVRWGEPAGARHAPEVEERWTVFPDGTAVRRQRYWASLDSPLEQHVLGNQVAEIDVVWAADTVPEDATPKNAATVFSPGQALPVLYPSQRRDEDPKFGDKPVFGIAVHSLDPALPDVFAVFAQANATNPPYQVSTDHGPDWHRERLWRFSHFPFSEIPFQYETNSQTEGRGRVTHSSLVYVGAPAGRDWTSQVRMDGRGRKYREWTSVVGLAPSKAFTQMLAQHHRALRRVAPSARSVQDGPGEASPGP